jgi:hypothetical protein
MMADRRCELMDSRLRRCPPDRAIAVHYGQATENALRLPTLPTGRRLPTSFTAPQQHQGHNYNYNYTKRHPSGSQWRDR